MITHAKRQSIFIGTVHVWLHVMPHLPRNLSTATISVNLLVVTHHSTFTGIVHAKIIVMHLSCLLLRVLPAGSIASLAVIAMSIYTGTGPVSHPVYSLLFPLITIRDTSVPIHVQPTDICTGISIVEHHVLLHLRRGSKALLLLETSAITHACPLNICTGTPPAKVPVLIP